MKEIPKPADASFPFAAGLAVAALAGSATPRLAAAGVSMFPGTVITTLDYLDSGSTVAALNDIVGSFNSYLQVGPDVFYSFTVASGGVMTFQLQPAAGYDAGIGLFTGSLAQPDWPASADAATAGGLETLAWPVVAGQTYHFVVDSAYAATDPKGSGAYVLTVTGDGNVTLVPEGDSLLLVGLGVAAVGWRRRRRGAV